MTISENIKNPEVLYNNEVVERIIQSHNQNTLLKDIHIKNFHNNHDKNVITRPPSYQANSPANAF